VPLPATDVPPVAVVHERASDITVDGYAAIASQYVYRGVALRDRPTPSVALTTSLPHGVFIDAWTGLVDADGRYDYEQRRYLGGHQWDLDTSVGYGAAISDDWQWSVAAARITAIGGRDRFAHDYDEYRANLFYRESVRAQVAYSPDYKSQTWTSWNVELAGAQSLTDTITGEWGIGRSHGAGPPSNDYVYGWLGVAGMWLRTQWDVRWVDAQKDGQYVNDHDSAGSRVVVSLSWSVRAFP
jgi:uncharacterized protein (TIGR02001 family)